MNIFDINGYRRSGFNLQQSEISNLQQLWKSYLESISSYPNSYEGKGIVMCGGGVKYFTCSWIAIKHIRETGCRLPIELWYLGSELSKEVICEIEKLGVECKDLTGHVGVNLKGYMLKPYAIIKSRFKEVLFIDADNICIHSPEKLFNATEYINYGAIFWPDYWKTPATNPIWKITGVKFTEDQEQESGQLLINKERCWKAINLCLHFNILGPVYYKILMGDKDTFRFAWKSLNQPYFMVPHLTGTCGYLDKYSKFHGTTMVQHDIEGNPLFMHRNLLKWDVTQENEFIWQKIKRFLPDAGKKAFYLNYSEYGHYYIDIKGDVEEFNCNPHLMNIETQCLQMLNELRTQDFYKRFLLYSYISKKRYNK